MNLFEIVNMLELESSISEEQQLEAAEMLRRQHEAIKVLRECLRDCLDDSRQVAEEYAASYGNYRPERLAAMRKTVADAEQALADTEEI